MIEEDIKFLFKIAAERIIIIISSKNMIRERIEFFFTMYKTEIKRKKNKLK